MMAAPRYTSRIHSLFLTTSRFVHLSRTSQKKSYNYDLDYLIKWKNETGKIFGPVRKTTKTGKLKKTKKSLDPQVEENLQILNALSVSQENSWDMLSSATAIKTCSKNVSLDKTTITDDNLLPTSDFIPACGQTEDDKCLKGIEHQECHMKDNFCDIPDNVLMSMMMPYNSEPTVEQRIEFDDRASNDEVIIPKISPIPTFTSVTPDHKFLSANSVNRIPPVNTVTSVTCENVRMQAGNQSNDIVNTTSLENLMPVSNISTIHNAESVLSKPKNSKNSKVTKKKYSSKSKEDINSDANYENSLEQKKTGTELFIPKMKPIPLGTSFPPSNSSQLQTGNSSVPSFKSSVTKAVQNLPFEPPESFELISKVPLLPKESNDWQRRLDSHLFDAFKTDVEQMSLRALPSVKTILNKTMSDLNRFFLNRWREGLIKELGEEGFKKQQDATIRKGVNLHANIMELLSGKPAGELQIMPENEGHWCSLQSGLAAVSGVRALEMGISHSMLMYRGVFDCLAQYKGVLCMIDWKTSNKPRPLLKNTYDDPVQIAAYIGALNANDAYIDKYGQVSHGVIVVAYPDGSPAHIHVMNRLICEQHWQYWTERLYNYYQLTYTEKMAANMRKINAKHVISSVGAAQ